MTTSPATRVLIADDNASFRKGVRLRLNQAKDIIVVGEAASGSAAVVFARAQRADVVLMDLEMPGGSGLAATRELAGPDADNPIIVIALTAHAERAYIFEALEAGARGYLLKANGLAHLVGAIKAATRGDAPVSSKVTASIIEEFGQRRRDISRQSDASISVLSPAEIGVVSQLCQGHTTNEEIAANLFVSVNTVHAQLAAALRKTGLCDRTQLALWAVRRGLDRSTPVRSATADSPNG